MNKNGEYITITNSNFEKEVLKSKDPVMVEFCAKWSGSCQIIEPVLENVVPSYRNKIKLAKCDVDSNNRLAFEYGIQILPTFLFFKNGKIVTNIIGVVPQKILETKIETLVQ